MSEPLFFATPAELRAWFAAHAADGGELLLGFWKKGTGRASVTWPEAVDEALCVGWIDGVRRRIDDDSYCIRFTPRKATSTWSAVNVARMAELERQGRVTPAGRAAFAARREDRTGIYSYERGAAGLGEHFEHRLRQDASAWQFWCDQPPSYRRAAAYWVTSAKQETTRERRFATLLSDCVARRRLRQLSR